MPAQEIGHRIAQNPPRKPSSRVSLNDSAPLPASTATANSTVPGTISPAIARHSTKATMNTAAASHCGLAASHPVTLSSHGPIKKLQTIDAL
jgi:hypothetical protein